MIARRNLFGLVLTLALGACLDRSRDPGPTAEPARAVLDGAPDVNAPVAPEAIYVGREGGLSIVDLNGFGQGTGDLALTRFPLNPNIGPPGVFPPLAPGSSARDAGSGGALTLVRDDAGATVLAGATMPGIRALVLGQPLDLLFHNENINVHAAASNHVNPRTGSQQHGNCIESMPHPNPPRLVKPSPNPARGIDCEEPTTTTSVPVPGQVTTTSPPCISSSLNLLVPGNPFSSQQSLLGVFASNHPGVFVGPQPPPPMPPPPPPFCPYTVRQQIGHFLYALQPAQQRVVVLNSNRCTVLATIALPDPVAMAISPDLRLLAVACRARDEVAFIDTDPRSATFHQVVATTRVGNQPHALAWQPEGEDLLVANFQGGSVSILDGSTLSVRRTLHRFIHRPQRIAVTPRQAGLGLGTGSYYAFVLDRFDRVLVYESANGAGTGADDLVSTSTAPAVPGASELQLDMASLSPALWIAHRDQHGLGQVSRHELVSQGGQLGFQRTVAIGGLSATTPVHDLFTGNQIVGLCFDDLQNRGALPDRRPSPLPPGALQHSLKGVVKNGPSGFEAAHAPMFLFVALGDTGNVDVMELATGARVATLDVPDVRCLGNYFRQ